MEKIRKLENFHILLWLLKDLSWLMGWKILGLSMIVPAVSFAAFIAWQSRNSSLLFWPNVAVVFWISANAFWMFTEFFVRFEHLKEYTAVPFAIGLVIISLYTISVLIKGNRRL